MRMKEKRALKKFYEIFFESFFEVDSSDYVRLIQGLLESVSELYSYKRFTYIVGNHAYELIGKGELRQFDFLAEEKDCAVQRKKIVIVEKDNRGEEHYFLFNPTKTKSKDIEETLDFIIDNFRIALLRLDEIKAKSVEQNDEQNISSQEKSDLLFRQIKQLEIEKAKLQKESQFLNQNFRMQKSINLAKSLFFNKYLEDLQAELKIALGMITVQPDEEEQLVQWDKKVRKHIHRLLNKKSEEISFVTDANKFFEGAIPKAMGKINISELVYVALKEYNQIYVNRNIQWEIDAGSGKFETIGDRNLIGRLFMALLIYLVGVREQIGENKEKLVFQIKIKCKENLLLFIVQLNNNYVRKYPHKEILEYIENHKLPHPDYGNLSIYLMFIVKVLSVHNAEIEFLDNRKGSVCQITFINESVE